VRHGRRRDPVKGWQNAIAPGLLLPGRRRGVARGRTMTRTMPQTTRATASLGVPWEQAYGYAQAVRVDRTIYVSGQLSHDEAGRFIGAPPRDDAGGGAGSSTMALQMRTAYGNARTVLAQLGASLDDVVDEVLYVTNMAAAFAAAGPVRRAAYGGTPACASTIVEVGRLAFPEQLVEIRLTAVARA
jgi:enamine deaminase RidA (YjgF/YER057c/UK114 family)